MSKKIISVGLDMGYGDTKATNGEKTITIPSVIGSAQLIQYQQTDFFNKDGIHLIVDNNEYFVGDMALQQANVMRQSLDRRRSMLDTKMLAYSAFSELQLADGEHIHLVTGLPVNWLSADKGDLKILLEGEHVINRVGHPKKTIYIDEVVCIPQPFGTYFYAMLSDDRIKNPAMKTSLVGIVDIGMFTTDFVFVENTVFKQPASSSCEIAMSEIYKQLATQLEIKYNYTSKNKLHSAKLALQRGFIKRPNKTKIDDLVESIANNIADSIIAEINTYWSGYENDMDYLFIAGGGASTIGPYLTKRYPYLSIVPDTATSNVIGYYRYSRLKQRNQ